jgi:hypothetical protein
MTYEFYYKFIKIGACSEIIENYSEAVASYRCIKLEEENFLFFQDMLQNKFI